MLSAPKTSAGTHLGLFVDVLSLKRLQNKQSSCAWACIPLLYSSLYFYQQSGHEATNLCVLLSLISISIVLLCKKTTSPSSHPQAATVPPPFSALYCQRARQMESDWWVYISSPLPVEGFFSGSGAAVRGGRTHSRYPPGGNGRGGEKKGLLFFFLMQTSKTFDSNSRNVTKNT